MRTPLVFAFGLFLTLVSLSLPIAASADEPIDKMPVAAAAAKDMAEWMDLFAKDNFDRLEEIGQELMTSKSKYRNGRGRFWAFTWTPLEGNRVRMTDEKFLAAIGKLDAWLTAKPDSVVARLLLAQCWSRYGWLARGGGFAAGVPDENMRRFGDRNQKAAEYLDQAAEKTDKVDGVYRRLRIEVAKALSDKPDLDLVYDGLKDDPLNMEIVHGMTICLLPRWFGEQGELEVFADEVVRRTKDVCGELHYVTAALAAKEFVGNNLLDVHAFDWQRLKQGFRDFEKHYPHDTEHLQAETQLAFLAGDLDAVSKLLERIGNDVHPEAWKPFGVAWEDFQLRFKPDMLQGDHKRLIASHAAPVMSLGLLGDGEYLISVDWQTHIRFHELATGERIGYQRIYRIRAESASIHAQAKLLACGHWDDPGVVTLNLETGDTGRIPTSEKKVFATAFSPKGDRLAAADEDGLIAVVDLTSGKTVHKLVPEPPQKVPSLAFSPDGGRLAAGCDSGDLLVFDMNAGKLEGAFKMSNHKLPAVAWSGSHLAAGTVRGGVAVIEWPSKKEIAAWGVQPVPVVSLAFSPNGDKLAIGVAPDNGNTLVEEPAFVWNYQSEPTPTPLKGHRLGVYCVRFGRDGKTLVTGSSDWTVRVWDVP